MKGLKIFTWMLVFVLVVFGATTVMADDGGDAEPPDNGDSSVEEPTGEEQEEEEEPAGEEPPAKNEEEEPAGAEPAAEEPSADSEEEEEPCDVLPQEGEEPVDGTYTVDSDAPVGSDNFEGDLEVEGEVFKDVPTVCGEEEDVIYIGTETDFSVCEVTDVDCLNAMRTEQGAEPFDQDQATSYGRSFDDVFEDSVGSGDYTPAVDAFRWMTGNVDGESPFEAEGDETIGTWIGLPENESRIQSLAWWLGDDCCYDTGDDPPPEEPPEEPPEPTPTPRPRRVKTQADTGVNDMGMLLAPALMAVGFLLRRKK